MCSPSTVSRRSTLCALAAAPAALLAAEPAPKRWYKGNLHTHTLNSDGDAAPLDVAAWYRAQGYQFLVLSDHNFLTEVAGLNAVIGAAERFLLIPGEEVTDSAEAKPVHLNAYLPDGYVAPQHGQSVIEAIQNDLAAIRAQHGLAVLNHPNFGWAVSAADLLAVKNLTHFEVYNGHPGVNNHGGGGLPSTDELWDSALTAGQRLFGVAVDDAHNYKAFSSSRANPGRGWVVVRAAALTAKEIIAALGAGDFYSSTGVELDEVRVTAAEYRIRAKPRGSERFTTYFIGAHGRTLQRSIDNEAVYRIRGDEAYVRARVESSSGATAWTQPCFPVRG